jgi:RsiW-degrading membrane proteinase PrsW (M82 family)
MTEVGNVDADERWPVLQRTESSVTRKKLFFLVIAVWCVLCLSMGYIFALYYRRGPDLDIGGLVLCSGISVVGFLAVLIPPTLYLRVFNPLWTAVTFLISTGLLFLLVSHKVLVTKHIKDLSKDHIARDAFSAYISAGLLEEIVKLLTYLVPVILSNQYRTVYDLCYLSMCSGSTFATLENLTTAYYGTSTSLQRFLWCTATHTSDCLSGALILAHIKSRDLGSWRWICYAGVLLVPCALHGTYDFVIFVGEDDTDLEWLRFLSILCGVISLCLCFALFLPFRRALAKKSGSMVSFPCHSSTNYPLV